MSRIVAVSDVCDPALPPRTSHHAQSFEAASRVAGLSRTVRLVDDRLIGGRQDGRPGTGPLAPDHLYHHSVPQLPVLTDKARGGCAGEVSA